MNNCHQLQLGASGLAFDPLTGDSFTLNETGVSLLQSIMTHNGCVENAASLLAEEFGISPQSAHNDTVDFVSRLHAFGIL
ncbi:PqqD family protein [Desulfovibrio inopinatus]|uniref:PqqD family protein n=1 Tax=Desulfovibrio inopinatus TaxID=102109 RepID=UPI000404DC34|nr:PqqD family protein [Desulfovibrio inopinatus]